MKKLISILVIVSLSFSCDEGGDCAPADRTGAVCKDGSTSTATGSGACSGHGGVDYWICK